MRLNYKILHLPATSGRLFILYVAISNSFGLVSFYNSIQFSIIINVWIPKKIGSKCMGLIVVFNYILYTVHLINKMYFDIVFESNNIEILQNFQVFMGTSRKFRE